MLILGLEGLSTVKPAKPRQMPITVYTLESGNYSTLHF